MKVYFIIVLFIFTYFALNKNEVQGKARGGGGRGGGSRSGGSRSGSRSTYRSGSGYRSSGSIKSRSIVVSSRYNTWSVRVGVPSSTRYKVSPWGIQHRAIISGHIIMSPYQRSRFHMSDRSYYDDISVCYNEEPLYYRNVTASPWFICPWDDISERYCCGDEVEERCCQYFDRTGPKVMVIIGISLIILIVCVIFCWYKKTHKADKTEGIIFMHENKVDDKTVLVEAPLLAYNPVPGDNGGQPILNPTPDYNNLVYPPYPTTIDNQGPSYPNYPAVIDNNCPYPTAPAPMDNSLPYPTNFPVTDNVYHEPMNNQLPYPSYSATADSALPYPTNPIPGANNGSMMPNNSSAIENYTSQPPPSYDDALKIKN